MTEIKRFSEEPNEFGDYDIVEDPNGEYMLYNVHVAEIKRLEEQLVKVTTRYNYVRNMTPEQFENTSTIHEDFDGQIDAAIKGQQDHIPDVGKMVQSQSQQPTAYRVIASANGEVVRDSLEFTRMSEIDEKVVRKSYDLEIVPLYSAMQSQTQQPNAWQQAIDDELVNAHLGIAKDGITREEAKAELNKLVAWHIDVAKYFESQAQQESQEIGEMRENGVNWYGKNPHAFAVGTKFFALPPAPEGDKE